MHALPVVIAEAFLSAIPLTLVLSFCVLWQYQRALLHWMRREPPPSLAAPPNGRITPTAGDGAMRPSPQPLPSLVELQKLERHHWALLVLLWLFIGITAAELWLGVHAPPPGLHRVLAMGIAWSAPGWMMLGLIARLPIRRGVALVVVCLLAPTILTLLMTNSASQSAMQSAMSWLTVSLLLPLPFLLVLSGIPSLRATAPLLFPPVFGATTLAWSGLETLHILYKAGWDSVLISTGLPPKLIVLLAALMPLIAGVAGLHAISRAFAWGFSHGWLTDHSFSVGAVAAFLLLQGSLPGSYVVGTSLALLPLLAWLWVPVGFGWLLPRLRPAPPSPGSTLLVLRLFRRPGPVGWLFDQVVQRWRFVGPVLLITASDLAARTLDPDELVQFLEGRLGERFLSAGDPVPDVDRAAAMDGRFRVHEFCCYDSSWQMVLEQLLQRSDVVLMDLRGFGAAHRGCLHELGRLGASSHLQRVVLLADDTTDRTTASEAYTGPTAPPLRWVDERRRRHATMEAVLGALTRGPSGEGA